MKAKRSTILVIEDDVMLTEFISEYLSMSGFTALIANTALSATRILNQHKCDLIILDLNLPDEDGLVLLRKWQHTHKVPIMVISSRGDDETRIAALELGAVDYLVKPFNPKEFLLRIKNILSYKQSPTAQTDTSSVVPLHNEPSLSIDLSTRQVITTSNHNIVLTRSEFDILTIIAVHAGKVVSRDVLMDAINFQDKEVNPNTLGVLMHRLRKKLSVVLGDHQLIITVPNLGYRLNL